MLGEIIRESPAYKMLTKEAYKEGVQEGIELGFERARQKELDNLRQLLFEIVKGRFPKLARLSKKQGIVVEDADALSDLILKVSLVPTIEEAKQRLLAVDEGEEDI
jgi:hypothetical protein